MLNTIRILKVLFFLIILILAGRTFWTLSHTFTPDFSVYYQAAKNIVSANSVYTGKSSFTLFAYPLVSALFFIPFSFFPYQISQTVFLSLNFLALVGISALIPIIVTKKHSYFLSALIFSFSYLSFPTKFTLGMGQVNLIAYFFLLLSILFLSRSHLNMHVKVRPLIALFFAFASILKPILGFVLLFFILQKRWKIIMYISSFIVCAIVLAIFIDSHAMQDYVYYLRVVIPEVSKPVGKEIYYNQGVISFVFREIANQQWRLPLSYLGIVGIFGLGMFAMIKSKQYLYQISILLTTLPLLDTLSWQHHFIVLIFPFFYAAHGFIQKGKWYSFGFLCLAYFLVSSNFAHPEIFGYFPANLLLSNTFYGGLLLFILLLMHQKLFQKKISE